MTRFTIVQGDRRNNPSFIAKADYQKHQFIKVGDLVGVVEFDVAIDDKFTLITHGKFWVKRDDSLDFAEGKKVNLAIPTEYTEEKDQALLTTESSKAGYAIETNWGYMIEEAGDGAFVNVYPK